MARRIVIVAGLVRVDLSLERRRCHVLATLEAQRITRRSETPRQERRRMSATARARSTNGATRGVAAPVARAPSARHLLALAALFLVRLAPATPRACPPRSSAAGAGHHLPPLAGLERDGKPVPGLDGGFKGAVTLLNVWASWCAPCRDEAPLLLALAQDHRHPHRRHQLQGPARQRAAFPRPLRQSVRRQRRRRATAAPRSSGASTGCRRPS